MARSSGASEDARGITFVLAKLPQSLPVHPLSHAHSPGATHCPCCADAVHSQSPSHVQKRGDHTLKLCRQRDARTVPQSGLSHTALSHARPFQPNRQSQRWPWSAAGRKRDVSADCGAAVDRTMPCTHRTPHAAPCVRARKMGKLPQDVEGGLAEGLAGDVRVQRVGDEGYGARADDRRANSWRQGKR